MVRPESVLLHHKRRQCKTVLVLRENTGRHCGVRIPDLLLFATSSSCACILGSPHHLLAILPPPSRRTASPRGLAGPTGLVRLASDSGSQIVANHDVVASLPPHDTGSYRKFLLDRHRDHDVRGNDEAAACSIRVATQYLAGSEVGLLERPRIQLELPGHDHDEARRRRSIVAEPLGIAPIVKDYN